MQYKSSMMVLLVSVPMMLSASGFDHSQFHKDTSNIPHPQKFFSCPKGWKMVYNIAYQRNKWHETSPIITCKPIKPLMECPEGTYFYVKGLGYGSSGYRYGEIGCATTVW